MTKHLIPRFGELALCDVTTPAIQTYVTHLIQVGYAPKSIDHIHDVLSAILRSAVKWGHLQTNPARGVEMPRLKTVRPKWAFTVEQAIALFEHLPWPKPRTMVGLALLGGARAVNCSRSGGKTSTKAVDVCTSMRRLRGYVRHAEDRRQPAADSVWRTRHSSCSETGGVWFDGQDRMISSSPRYRGSRSLRITSSGTWVWPACKAAGLSRATWLTFRRTYSSWAHDKGVPPKVVAAIMGHSKVDTTLNVYTQVLDGAAREAADRIGSELARIGQKPRGTMPLTH